MVAQAEHSGEKSTENRIQILYTFRPDQSQQILAGKLSIASFSYLFTPGINSGDEKFFRVVGQDKNTGQIIIYSTRRAPLVAGYLWKDGNQITYGNAHDGHVTWRHHQGEKYSQLVFFEDEKIAALLAEPCGSCWVSPSQSDAAERWATYSQTRYEAQRTWKVPTPSLESHLPIDEDVARFIALLRNELRSLIDPESEETISITRVYETAATLLVSKELVLILPALSRMLEELSELDSSETFALDEILSIIYNLIIEEHSIKLVKDIEQLATQSKLNLQEWEPIIKFVILGKNQEKKPKTADVKKLITLLGNRFVVEESIDTQMLSSYLELCLLALSTFPTLDLFNTTENEVQAIIGSKKNTDRLIAGETSYFWRTQLNRLIDTGVFPQDDTEDASPKTTKQIHELTEIYTRDDFNLVGKIAQSINGKGVIALESITSRRDCPYTSETVEAILTVFEEVDLLRFTTDSKDRFKLTKKGLERGLTYGALREAIQSADLILSSLENGKTASIRSFADVRSRYEAGKTKIKKPEIFLTTDQPSPKVLHLPELHLGHKDSAIDFVLQIIEYIKSLPAEERPTAIVASGLIQGTFKYRQKDRRRTLVISDLGEQFKTAKMLIDDLEQLGIPLIINISDEAVEICRDMTIDVMQLLVNASSSIMEAQTFVRFVPYWRVDQLRQTEAWDTHNDFILEVVYPFCLRSGRDLLEADEMGALTGRDEHEYFLLYKAYHDQKAGKPIDPFYLDFLENVEQEKLNGKFIGKAKGEAGNIPTPTKKFDYPIVDGLQLIIEGPSGKTVIDVAHNPRYSKALYSEPFGKTPDIIAQLMNAGEPVANSYVTQHQALGAGFQAATSENGDGIWVESLPPLKGVNLNQADSALQVAGDSMWKTIATRGQWFRPSVVELGIDGEGRHIVEPRLEKFYDKMSESPDRQVVMHWADWQVGSPTARLDYQVKQIDRLAQLLQQGYKVNLIINGDIIHGNNYKTFTQESRRSNLINIDDQKYMVEFMIVNGLGHLSAKELENLTVNITIGNHEANSGFAWPGTSHSDYLSRAFSLLFQKNNLDPAQKISVAKIARTAQGEHFESSIVKREVAGHGIMAQHQVSGSGNYPILKAIPFISSRPGLFRDTDFFMLGHNHTASWLLFNDLMTIMSGSLAGTSSFDWNRVGIPTVGGVEIHLGAGKLPVVSFSSLKTFAEATVRSGFFSDEQLLTTFNLLTDRGFDPIAHGFGKFPGQPHSALQKVLLEEIDRRLWPTDNNILG